MKDKSNIKYIFGIIISIIVSSVISVTAAGTLFDSNEVVYDNSNSGLNASTVKGAIDELYAAANNYAAYDDRLVAVEDNNVVASGTVSNWYYRKYSDGTLDLWTSYTVSASQASAIANNSLYQYNLLNIGIPASIRPINANYIVSGSARIGNGYGIIACTTGETVSSFNLILVSSSSGTQNVTYKLYIHGAWK